MLRKRGDVQKALQESENNNATEYTLSGSQSIVFLLATATAVLAIIACMLCILQATVQCHGVIK